jgi:PKD repeat protein
LTVAADGTIYVADRSNHTIRKCTRTPTITSSLTASGTVGAAFSYQITANNNPTSFSATNLPPGLAINTGIGAIVGTPTAGGETAVTISATNSYGTASATLTITITGQAPAITSSLTATGTVGQAFSYTIEASGATPMTFEATPLPAGLSLSGATISGTPTTEGSTNVSIKVTNSAGSDTKTLAVTINPTGAPTITSSLTATGQVGQSFSYQITASGNAPITYEATGLPAGLSFAGDTISGTPTTVGKTDVTIKATNASGTDKKTLEVTINAAGAPTITSSLSQSAKAGTAFSYTIAATGPGPITFGATGFPAWLTFSGATLSGTPQAADVGTYKVNITATNASGTDSQTLSISVAPVAGDPPVPRPRSAGPARRGIRPQIRRSGFWTWEPKSATSGRRSGERPIRRHDTDLSRVRHPLFRT